MKSYAAFILAHENCSSALKKTLEKITGKQNDIYPYSNKTDTLPCLCKDIKGKILSLKKDNYIIFVDLKGGSCWTLANMLKKDLPELDIVSGVNIPMLVSYAVNRNKYSRTELIKKIKEDGCRGIVLIPGEKRGGSTAI